MAFRLRIVDQDIAVVIKYFCIEYRTDISTAIGDGSLCRIKFIVFYTVSDTSQGKCLCDIGCH